MSHASIGIIGNFSNTTQSVMASYFWGIEMEQLQTIDKEGSKFDPDAYVVFGMRIIVINIE
jgi:hypothetical protein